MTVACCELIEAGIHLCAELSASLEEGTLTMGKDTLGGDVLDLSPRGSVVGGRHSGMNGSLEIPTAAVGLLRMSWCAPTDVVGSILPRSAVGSTNGK